MDRSNDWLAKQLLTIGSSAAGTVTGTSPYQTVSQLFDAMVAADDGKITASDINDDMRRGILTEPLHRQLLGEALGEPVTEHDQDNFLYTHLYPWAHALPDGWLPRRLSLDGVTSHQSIPVQLKCPRIKGWYDIKLKGIHGNWLVGSQHSLAVTGAPFEHFSVLNVESMRLIHFPVYRDEEMITRIMEMEKEFYKRFQNRARPAEVVAPLDMPPLDGNLLTLDTAYACDIASAYTDARLLREEAQALIEDAEKRITELMGDARVAQFPMLRCHLIQQPGRITYNATAMRRDGIDLAKYERRGEPYSFIRTFATNE